MALHQTLNSKSYRKCFLSIQFPIVRSFTCRTYSYIKRMRLSKIKIYTQRCVVLLFHERKQWAKMIQPAAQETFKIHTRNSNLQLKWKKTYAIQKGRFKMPQQIECSILGDTHHTNQSKKKNLVTIKRKCLNKKVKVNGRCFNLRGATIWSSRCDAVGLAASLQCQVTGSGCGPAQWVKGPSAAAAVVQVSTAAGI